VQSSVVATTRSAKPRTQALEEQKNDKKSLARNKRMFGMILGTLQKFQNEESTRKDTVCHNYYCHCFREMIAILCELIANAEKSGNREEIGRKGGTGEDSPPERETRIVFGSPRKRGTNQTY
jgi:hypothetical protein